jgi:2-methylcitrate dehydratase
VLSAAEIERFLGLAERLPELTAEEVQQLTIVAEHGVLASAPAPKGLF